jgi:hypothetical protein
MIALNFKRLFPLAAFFITIASQAQIRRIDTANVSESPRFKPVNTESPRQYMYSVGLKVYSIEEFPKILNQIDESRLFRPVLTGIFVKINDNQISYRLSANYYSDDISFKNECEECEAAKGEMKDFSTRTGFEKNFIYGKLQPYFAFDIGYRRNSFEGNVQNASTINYTNPYDVSTLKNSLSLSPAFGFKVNLIDHFALAIETGIGLLYSYEKQERTYQDANRTRTFNDYKKWEFLLRPISAVSVQYNFGLAY